MDYWASIVVPANTSELTPARETIEICPGVIKWVWFFFPKGHKGTTKVRVLRFEHQVWPTNPGGWYLGDGTTIDFEENYNVVIAPFELVLEGYNTSLSHSHTVYCHFTILPIEEVVYPLPPRSVGLF